MKYLIKTVGRTSKDDIQYAAPNGSWTPIKDHAEIYDRLDCYDKLVDQMNTFFDDSAYIVEKIILEDDEVINELVNL